MKVIVKAFVRVHRVSESGENFQRQARSGSIPVKKLWIRFASGGGVIDGQTVEVRSRPRSAIGNDEHKTAISKLSSVKEEIIEPRSFDAAVVC